MNALPPSGTIREATEHDIARWLPIAQKAYPNRQVERGLPWIRWCIENPNRLALTGEHCCGIAEINVKYGFEPRACLSMLFSDGKGGMEPLRIIRQMVLWAKINGVVGSFTLDTDTGVDFGALARRLGGRPVDIRRWTIPL